MPKVIAEVSYSPIGTASPSLSRYITAALSVLKNQDRVKYQLNPMGTVLEGERAEVLALVEEMGEAIFSAGAQRVGTTLKIDDRRDKDTSMDHKVEVVREGLAKEV
ncbi:MAG: MTH1187 family thiamine-binding protein [Chloroflexota bacterium]|nr:MTH1187 family thiamine-binding protein [Chloroflexota bacterium]